MKRFIRLALTMIVMATVFISCHKENNDVDGYVKKRIRYEVTCDDPNKEVFIAYIGREHPDEGADIMDGRALSCDTKLPWSYEYNSPDNVFMAKFSVSSTPFTTEITGRLYIDGELIEEQVDDGNNYIFIYKEYNFNN